LNRFVLDVTESSLVKNSRGSTAARSGVLANTIPRDIVTASQRQRVLAAIAECCAAKTYSGTTIADIVARAGISRRTFYKLFPNKRACFEATVDAFTEEVAATVAEVQLGDDPWPVTTRNAIAAVLDLLVSKPAFANLALVEAVGVEPALINNYWNQLLEALHAQPHRGPGLPPRSDAARIAVGTGQVMIAREIAAGRTAELFNLLPDLIYIAILPFAGREEALEQARRAR
jgi:AcrR family transcriptional regulator